MAKSSQDTILPKQAYSIEEYCDSLRICRSTLYNLWRRGEGPVLMKVGGRKLISVEAAENYRRKCEGAGDA